jgi:hypothetical protein
VLDLLGVPAPASDGATLVDALHGRTGPGEREVYAESLYPRHLGWSPLFALRSGRYKLIDAPRPELYDLESDPFEQRNVYAERRGVAAAMTDRITAIRTSADAASAPRGVESSSPERRRRLASLGYASGTRDGSVPGPDRLPDAKDCIGASRLASAAPRGASPPAACGPPTISGGDVASRVRRIAHPP